MCKFPLSRLSSKTFRWGFSLTLPVDYNNLQDIQMGFFSRCLLTTTTSKTFRWGFSLTLPVDYNNLQDIQMGFFSDAACWLQQPPRHSDGVFLWRCLLTTTTSKTFRWGFSLTLPVDYNNLQDIQMGFFSDAACWLQQPPRHSDGVFLWRCLLTTTTSKTFRWGFSLTLPVDYNNLQDIQMGFFSDAACWLQQPPRHSNGVFPDLMQDK